MEVLPYALKIHCQIAVELLRSESNSNYSRISLKTLVTKNKHHNSFKIMDNSNFSVSLHRKCDNSF